MLKGFLYAPVKLTPEQIHHVEEKFSESLQDQVQLVPQTDKSLIGGIRVEIDGRVLFTAAGAVPAGSFVNVRITGVSDGELTGEIEE